LSAEHCSCLRRSYLADLAGVFSTPPADASTMPSSSSRASAGRSRSRSIPPPSGMPKFSKVRVTYLGSG
jgi:hypothetical protein